MAGGQKLAALDYNEVATILSQGLGTKVEYQSISEEDMVQAAIKNGLPAAAAQYLALLYSGVRNGWFDIVTDDVQQVTGQSPRSLAEVVARRP
ncbi:MAG: hypothetical protein CVU69_00560 [Deltaproteobacteria bacterium HGW-Deltaproteobacteria-4]|nr:MAG: hypothetical protein CVU69_00560 [Deltaproteobacteria bacterium HGW-Deltaproteobacteria-4]